MEKKELVRTYCKVYRQAKPYYTNLIVIGVPATILIAALYLSTVLHNLITDLLTFGYGIAGFLLALLVAFNAFIIIYKFTTFKNKYLEMFVDLEVVACIDLIAAGITVVVFIIEIICKEFATTLIEAFIAIVRWFVSVFKSVVDSLFFVNGVAWFIVTICCIAVVGYVVAEILFKKYCVPKQGEHAGDKVVDTIWNIDGKFNAHDAIKHYNSLMVACEMYYGKKTYGHFYSYEALGLRFSGVLENIVFDSVMDSLKTRDLIHKMGEMNGTKYDIGGTGTEEIIEHCYLEEWVKMRSYILELR